MYWITLFALFCGSQGLFAKNSDIAHKLSQHVIPSLAENGGKYFPANILLSDSFFSHHILVAEKSTHRLHLFRNHKGVPSYLQSYLMATGKKSGNKSYQGDHKTPEGIYFFTQFIPKQDLLSRYGDAGKIYGAGAFVMDYPNYFDRQASKTGGGIWLHSTNNVTRISKGLDSRGCIVVNDEDLYDISRMLELRKTPIIVVENLQMLPRETWSLQQDKLHSFLQSWITSWREENLKNYISHYDPKFNDGRTYSQFKTYKRAVFNNVGRPHIEMDNLSIFIIKNRAIVTYRQTYRSPSIDDVGIKNLYLTLDNNYNWKIVTERWHKLERKNPLPFLPSERFFRREAGQVVVGNSDI